MRPAGIELAARVCELLETPQVVTRCALLDLSIGEAKQVSKSLISIPALRYIGIAMTLTSLVE